MLYIIYGEDTYRSRKKLHELSSDPALIGQGGVLQCDASVGDIGKTMEGMASRNLFGDSSAYVIAYPMSGRPENLEWLSAHSVSLAQSSAAIILWDSVSSGTSLKKKPFRKTKSEEGIERFFAHANGVFEFPKLTNSALQKYILTMAEDRGVALSPGGAALLANESAGDLWMVDNELEKYRLTGSFEYERKTEVAEKLYDFMDALALGEGARAFALLENIKEAGFEDPYIIAALAGMLRAMIKVKAILPTNPTYAKLGEFGMHEFVLKKTLSHIRRFRMEDLKRLYLMVAEADRAVKTSDVDSSVLYARIIYACEYIVSEKVE